LNVYAVVLPELLNVCAVVLPELLNVYTVVLPELEHQSRADLFGVLDRG